MQRSNTGGFTIVEVLVIAPIVLLMIGTFIGTIIYLTGEVLAARANNTLMYEVQDALEVIERDVRLSGAFLGQNNRMASGSQMVVSPQGANNATQAFTSINGSTDTLILNVLATTANPQDPTRQPVYLSNMPHACGSTQVQQNQIMTMNVVYFVRDNALWRRVLAPSNYTTRGCPGQVAWQVPSCAPNYTATFCRTQDMRLVNGITPEDFKVNYYSTAQSTAENTNAKHATLATRQEALNNTTTVQITIRGSMTVAGRDISRQGTIRATRIGTLINYATPVP